MKSKSLPIFCGVALVAMTAAVASHWWSVRQIVTVFETGEPVVVPKPQPEAPAKATKPAKPAKGVTDEQLASVMSGAEQAPADEAGRKDFYEALITRMESLQTQNRDLLDQLAETNRDLMKLEFRVDTHSESFRPLPVSEERIDATTIDDGPGVLPPRAEPVLLPTYE